MQDESTQIVSGGPSGGDLQQHVSTIGERVRSIRAQRGMTRKDLALYSEISERYLAQLESGKANITLALLWRLADAMGIHFDDLVCVQGTASPRFDALFHYLKSLPVVEQKRIYTKLVRRNVPEAALLNGVALVGMRGAGKSTIGKGLASALNWPFIQLTKKTENLAGMEIAELFSLGGQKSYRRWERQALEEVMEGDGPIVLETGGSLVTEKETYAALNQGFFSVWVRAHAEEHMERVLAQGDARPMQGNRHAMDDLLSILVEREPFYESARYLLDTSNRSVEACVQEITQVVRQQYSLASRGE